jgi:methionine sulfoxide reductase heme-binding subunit
MTLTTSATPHLFWITSRAAGIASLVLASLAVSMGLIMSLKFMRRRGPDLTTLHEALSLATLVALAVHGLSLLGDHFLSPSLADITLPFAWGYKTFWTSVGIIGGWGLAFLGLSYYFRRRIGVQRWRKLHRLTALMWVFGIVHTLGEGTDAGQTWFLAMLGIVAVPATALLLVRYLTEETPRAARPQGTRTPQPRVPQPRVPQPRAETARTGPHGPSRPVPPPLLTRS